MSAWYWMVACYFFGFFLGKASDDELNLKDYALMFPMAIFWPVTLCWVLWGICKVLRNG